MPTNCPCECAEGRVAGLRDCIFNWYLRTIMSKKWKKGECQILDLCSKKTLNIFQT